MRTARRPGRDDVSMAVPSARDGLARRPRAPHRIGPSGASACPGGEPESDADGPEVVLAVQLVDLEQPAPDLGDAPERKLRQRPQRDPGHACRRRRRSPPCEWSSGSCRGSSSPGGAAASGTARPRSSSGRSVRSNRYRRRCRPATPCTFGQEAVEDEEPFGLGGPGPLGEDLDRIGPDRPRPHRPTRSTWPDRCRRPGGARASAPWHATPAARRRWRPRRVTRADHESPNRPPTRGHCPGRSGSSPLKRPASSVHRSGADRADRRRPARGSAPDDGSPDSAAAAASSGRRCRTARTPSAVRAMTDPPRPAARRPVSSSSCT